MTRTLMASTPKSTRRLGGFLLALSLAAGSMVSCTKGKEEGPPGVEEILRPAASESSGWSGARGPSKLGDPETLDLGRGVAGVQGALSFQGSLFLLDFQGRVFQVRQGRMGLESRGAARGSTVLALCSVGDLLVVSEPDGGVRALRLSGQTDESAPLEAEAWRSHPGFPAEWLLASETGSILCVSSDGKLAALSAEDGMLQGSADPGALPVGGPAVTRDVLLVPCEEGIAAYRLPSMALLWRSEFSPAKGEGLRSFNGLLAAEDAEGALRILDAGTGEERYSLSDGAGARAASDGERLYLARPDGSLDAYKLPDGVPVWTTGASSVMGADAPESPPASPRLAVTEEGVYVAGSNGIEAWDPETGELLDRSVFSERVDDLVVLNGTLFAPLRGGGIYVYGAPLPETEALDLEAPARPEPPAVERIAAALEKYSAPGGGAPALAWRVYVPQGVMAAGAAFTIFRYEAAEPGKRILSFRPGDSGDVLMALFDSNGEERHVNVGELGVDASFEQWLEAGVWYIAFGRLRGMGEGEPVFLEIR